MTQIDFQLDGPSQLLARVALLQGLQNNSQALQALGQIMTLRSVEAGHTLITEGRPGEEFFVLVEGQVSIYKQTLDGDRYKVALLKSEVTPAFGEGGLIESEPRSATVVCDTDCKVLQLNRMEFLKFCETSPQWAVPILLKLSQNLVGNLRKTSNDLMLLHKALMNEIRS